MAHRATLMPSVSVKSAITSLVLVAMHTKGSEKHDQVVIRSATGLNQPFGVMSWHVYTPSSSAYPACGSSDRAQLSSYCL